MKIIEKKKMPNVPSVTYGWYALIFTISHGCMIFSIYLFVRWSVDINQWSFFAVSVVYAVLMLFDKLWFVFFFSWKSRWWVVFSSCIMLFLSIAYTIICALSNNLSTVAWLPPVLAIPFNVLMIYVSAFSCDWQF